MNSISKIDTTRMTNAAHIGYMEQTIKRAKESEKVSANLSPQLSVMEDRYAEEDKYPLSHTRHSRIHIRYMLSTGICATSFSRH